MFFKKTVFFKKSQPVLFLKYPCEIESFVYKQVYYEASLSEGFVLPVLITQITYFLLIYMTTCTSQSSQEVS